MLVCPFCTPTYRIKKTLSCVEVIDKIEISKWSFGRSLKQIYSLNACINTDKEDQPSNYGSQHRSLIQFNISLK